MRKKKMIIIINNEDIKEDNNSNEDIKEENNLDSNEEKNNEEYKKIELPSKEEIDEYLDIVFLTLCKLHLQEEKFPMDPGKNNEDTKEDNNSNEDIKEDNNLDSNEENNNEEYKKIELPSKEEIDEYLDIVFLTLCKLHLQEEKFPMDPGKTK